MPALKEKTKSTALSWRDRLTFDQREATRQMIDLRKRISLGEMKGLVWNGRSKKEPTLQHIDINVRAILEALPCVREAFVYSEFDENIRQIKPIPVPPECAWRPTSAGRRGFPRDVTDADLQGVVNILNWFGICFRDKAAIKLILSMVAEETSVNFVEDYLENLEWDGVSRINNWMSYALGAEDTPLNSIQGRKFLIGACRRGVSKEKYKFDSVLYLYGKKGVGKSTAVSRLFDGLHFRVGLPSLKNLVEAKRGLYKFWACELPEGSALKGVDEDAVKEFITTEADTVRGMYQDDSATRIRRTVFLVTTNRTDFIKEDPGDRRYWVVTCGVNPKFDPMWLVHNRDQLWAEAYMLSKDPGNLTYLTDDELELLKDAQALFTYTSPLHSTIVKYLRVGSVDQIKEIPLVQLHGYLYSSPGNEIANASHKAIGTIMIGLGYNPVRKLIKGTRSKETIYRLP